MDRAEHTPRQTVRVDKALWDKFGATAGRERSEVVRQLIRWYVREPGAKLPQRPPAD